MLDSVTLLSHHNKPVCHSTEPQTPLTATVPSNIITQMKQAQTVSSYKIRNCIWQFFKQVHTSTAKSISVLPSARRVALVTFYVKQELPPDLEVHQEFC